MENVNLDFVHLIHQAAISTYPLILCSIIMLGVNYGPDENPLAILQQHRRSPLNRMRLTRCKLRAWSRVL